jgi:hypothetical protein
MPKQKLKPWTKQHQQVVERLIARHTDIIRTNVYDRELSPTEKLIRDVAVGATFATIVGAIILKLPTLNPRFAALWYPALRNVYEGTVTQASVLVSDIVGVKPPLDIQTLVDMYLRDQGAQNIKGILEEDQRWMSAVLRNGAQEGKETSEIIKDITTHFPDYSEGRAGTIARTEIHAADGYASNEMMKDAAPGMQKRWICMFQNSRDAHMDADGQTVDLEDDFEVGGESMAYPGGGDDPENNINCQCIVEYIPRGS